MSEHISISLHDWKQLVGRSNTLYGEMLSCLEILHASPKAAMDPLSGCRFEKFREIQQQIEQNDTLITSQFSSVFEQDSEAARLLAERRNLLEQLVAKNREVKTRAESVKSLIRNELQKSQQGQTALQGYRQYDSLSKSGSFSRSF